MTDLRSTLVENNWEVVISKVEFQKGNFTLIADTSNWWELYYGSKRIADIQNPTKEDVEETMKQINRLIETHS